MENVQPFIKSGQKVWKTEGALPILVCDCRDQSFIVCNFHQHNKPALVERPTLTYLEVSIFSQGYPILERRSGALLLLCHPQGTPPGIWNRVQPRINYFFCLAFLRRLFQNSAILDFVFQAVPKQQNACTLFRDIIMSDLSNSRWIGTKSLLHAQ